jgi:hypothetical protein
MENEEQPIRQNPSPSKAITIPLSIIAFIMAAYFFQSISAGNCASRIGQAHLFFGQAIASRWSFTEACMVLVSGGAPEAMKGWMDERSWDVTMQTAESVKADVEAQ